MSAHAIDVTSTSFEREVLEASRSRPVVVDFWAPWCGPCRVLKPILEKLATEYGGRFLLAKVNSDENQQIAAAYGVRSIPDVYAFRDGKPVTHFLGAMPESQVRAFIEKLLPSPSQLELRRGLDLVEAGDAAGALAALEKAVALDGGNSAARLAAAELLIAATRLDAAETMLSEVPPDTATDQQVAALRASIGFARSGATLDVASLEKKLLASPADHETRLALSQLHAGARRFAAALDQLLEILKRDKSWRDGEARKQYVAILTLAANQPDLVSDYRRRLASALY